MTPEQKQRLNEIRAIVNGSRYEQGRYYELGGSSLGGGPKYLGEAGKLLREVLALVKSQEILLDALHAEIRASESYQGRLPDLPDPAVSIRSACVEKVRSSGHEELAKELECLSIGE